MWVDFSSGVERSQSYLKSEIINKVVQSSVVKNIEIIELFFIAYLHLNI